MATIVKISSKNGFRYKAIIKQHGRALKTKTFTTKTAARTWAKRTESDQEMIEAFGLPGVGITLDALVDEYMMQWKGKDKSRPARVSWWVSQLGNKKLTDIDSQLIRDCLEQYNDGHAMFYVGIDSHQQAKFKSSGVAT